MYTVVYCTRVTVVKIATYVFVKIITDGDATNRWSINEITMLVLNIAILNTKFSRKEIFTRVKI